MVDIEIKLKLGFNILRTISQNYQESLGNTIFIIFFLQNDLAIHN